MISVYNLVTRRPHVPREIALRRILISQGFEIPLETPPRPGPAVGSSRGDHPGDDDPYSDDDGNFWEEQSESEMGTDDECIALPMLVDPKGNSTAYIILDNEPS